MGQHIHSKWMGPCDPERRLGDHEGRPYGVARGPGRRDADGCAGDRKGRSYVLARIFLVRASIRDGRDGASMNGVRSGMMPGSMFACLHLCDILET